VGRSISSTPGLDLTSHKYAQWIKTYAGDGFFNSVKKVLGILENLAKKCTEEQLKAMERHVERGCKLEWMFWDAAYKKEAWPL